jgi:hypothetical protein
MYDFFYRHSFVLVNVPGPDRPFLIAGKVAMGVQMYLSNLLPQLSFMSYAGQVMGALVQLAERLDVPSPVEFGMLN